MSKQHLIHASILASLFIIGSLTIYGCTSVESVTISNVSQADSSQKTKIEVVLDGEVDKTQIAEFVESFGTAVAEGETLVFVTPTIASTPFPTRVARPTSTPVPDQAGSDAGCIVEDLKWYFSLGTLVIEGSSNCASGLISLRLYDGDGDDATFLGTINGFIENYTISGLGINIPEVEYICFKYSISSY